MSSFDDEIVRFMTARGVPGGSLAVVRNRKLIYARGYGWADRESRIPVRPTSLFRIASLSKPFTAVALMKLVEQNKLRLDDKTFDYIDLQPHLKPGRKVDPRLHGITIRQCLHHTGGWDRDRSFDPMFRAVDFARELGAEPPATAQMVIRCMFGQPLDFDPGQRYAYSNFGYCVLGRVIEKLTDGTYEQFVKESMLAPIGIQRMQIGRSLENGRVADEVRYYTADEEKADCVFASQPGRVPVQYGGFALEAMDSHGGWIASAIDLARFAAALDDPAKSPLLKPAFLEKLYEPPAPPVSRKKSGELEDAFYGLGWSVRPIENHPGKANYWHTGSLPGTNTLLVRRWDGLSWAVLFNQRSDDPKLPDNEIDPAMHRAAAAVKEWPEEDLFGQFG